MSLFGGGADVNVTNESDNLVNDIVVNRCEFGTCVPDICGTVKASANIINYQDIKSTKHVTTSTVHSGKGGGGSDTTTTTITYTYNVFLEMALSEGPIAGIGNVWVKGDLTRESDDYGTIGMPLEYKLGDQTRANDYMLSKHPTLAQVYPGLAYAYGYVYLGSSTTIPQYQFEVKGNLLSTGDGIDVNPADYIVYVLNKIGVDTTNIEGLANYRTYCREADLLISTPMDQGSASAQTIINRVLELTNAFMFWSNDRFKIVIKEDRSFKNWHPDLTVKYALDSDDFQLQENGAMVSYERKPINELYNRFTVNFPNRSNAYETESVSLEDADNISNYGLKQASSEECEWFYTKSRALHYLGVLGRNNYYGRNKYTFKLDWAYALLEPGDIVTLTDDSLGLEQTPARVISVTEENDGTIKVGAVSIPPLDDVTPQYVVEGLDYNYVDFNKAADNTDAPMFYAPPKALLDSSTGHQFYIALRGVEHDKATESWGGCNVYAAMQDDDTKKVYELVQTFRGESIYGTLAAACSASATDIEIAVNGVLASSFESLQKAGLNYVAIGDEVVSYREVTTNANSYTLHNCMRGQLKTSAKVHSIGEKVLRLDGNYVKIDVANNQLNKEYCFKFPSFNNFENAGQLLSTVQEYTYTPGGSVFTGLTGVSAYTEKPVADQEVYNLTIIWDVPDWAGYTGAKLYLKNGDNYSYIETGYNTAHIANVVIDAEYVFKLAAEDTYGALQTLQEAKAYSYIATQGEMEADDIVDKINNEASNTVDGGKITTGTITAAQIQAGAITTNTIAAGAITAQKLSSSLITLADSQGMKGGAVTLDASGMHCALENGSSVNFSSNGMSLTDSLGNVFSQICRFAAGTCSNGEIVNLGWDVVPKTVLLFPWNIKTMLQNYTAVDLFIVCEASGITKDGFTANVYTALKAGSYNDASAPAISVSTPRRGEWQEYTDYSDYSTVSGITSTTDQLYLEIPTTLYLYDNRAGGTNFIHYTYLYLEIYANDEKVYDECQFSITSVHYFVDGEKHTFKPQITIPIENTPTVKYRWRIKHYDGANHNGWQQVSEFISSSAATGQARVSKATKAEGGDGTAHYLALG